MEEEEGEGDGEGEGGENRIEEEGVREGGKGRERVGGCKGKGMGEEGGKEKGRSMGERERTFESLTLFKFSAILFSFGETRLHIAIGTQLV